MAIPAGMSPWTSNSTGQPTVSDTMTTGRVVSLQILTEHRQHPLPVAEVRALVGRGLEGDVHGKKRPDSHRQVLIVDRAMLAAMGLRPGDLREQITVEFPGLDRLAAGTRLRVGRAICELTGPCEPCTHIGGLLRVSDPRAFQQELEGRRGQLARIVAVDGDGLIRVGDPVVPAVPDPASA